MIVMLCVFGFVGCKTAHDIPVVHDTTYVNKYEIKHDSVYINQYKDRYHTVYMKNDTIFVYDSIYVEDKGHIRFIDEIHDTIYKYNEVPVEVVKEKRVINWRLAILIGLVGLVGGWMIRRSFPKFS